MFYSSYSFCNIVLHNVNAVISFVAAVLTVFVILPEFVVAQEPRSDVICNVLNITNLSIASKPSGGTDVLGIISNNNSTLTYESVGIVGEFYDSDDKLVGIETGNAEFSTLGPDDRSPFKVKTDVSNQTLDHYSLTCRSSEGRAISQLP
jgi:hypothetical protein